MDLQNDSLQKSPSETVRAHFDFTDFDGAGTLTGYAVSASQPGLGLVRSVLANGFLSIVLAGGLANWDYVVGVRVTRSDGLVSEQRITVRVAGPDLFDFEADGLQAGVPEGALLLGPDPIYFDTDNVVLT